MWNKAGVLGEPGSRSSNLALWTTAGLAITIGLSSSRKWVEFFNRKIGVLPITIGVCSSRKWVEFFNRKIGARGKNDNGIDRLPDDILRDIVSRLTLIEAIRTSILSKRWRTIWTININDSLMLSCLDVSKGYHHPYAHVDRQRFFKAVNQCLYLYSGRKLKLFYVHCCFLNFNTCHLERWMQTLAGLDVEELYLGHSCSTCNGVPLDNVFVFSFKLIDGLYSLKYLDLTSCYVGTSFVGQFNSLVMLNLRYMPLLSRELSYILMSCPNLTYLCLDRCELPLNLRISMPNLKLKTFDIKACYHVQSLEISNINVVKLMIEMHNVVEIYLSSIPKLECLHLSIPKIECLHLRTPGMQYSFEDTARDLPLLKDLLIETTYQIMHLPSTFQVFGNVRVLSLITKGYPYWGAPWEVDLWNFGPVLVACPLLEEFYLTVGGPFCKRKRLPTQWPVLQHKHLSLMELSGFSNTLHELEFAKFILKNAQVLRTLRLRPGLRRFKSDSFYFVKGTYQIHTEVDTEAAWAYLEGDYLSRQGILVEFIVD